MKGKYYYLLIFLLWLLKQTNTHLGRVYMRGGTGRLPGRDDARGPDMYMFLWIYRILFIWRRDVFRPVSPSRDPGLSGTIFAI